MAPTDLGDLQRLALHNVTRAGSRTPSRADAPFSAHVVDGGDRVPEVHSEEPAQAPAFAPPMGTASLTMALNSVLPSLKPLAAKAAKSNSAQAAKPVAGASGAIATPVTAGMVKNAVLPAERQSGRPGLQAIPVASFNAVKSIVGNAGKLFPNPLRKRVGAPGGGAPSGAAGRKVGLVWFRSDLRTHDNAALAAASKECSSLVPVFCFDPRDFGKSASGFDKTGPYRAKFLIECVADLRAKVKELGSELVVRIGKPEEVLRNLARSVGASAVFAHQEVTYEELQVENRVGAALKEEGVELKTFWGSTLYHMEDLPFKLEEMPSNYGSFREKVAHMNIRDCVSTPTSVKGLPVGAKIDLGSVPRLEDLGVQASAAALSSDGQGAGAGLKGGETEALQRLRAFVGETLAPKPPAAAGGGGKGEGQQSSFYSANFSCKISPWLAMGCLSPRKMYEELKKAGGGKKGGRKAAVAASASGRAADESNGLNWLVFELLWRDFFRFITHKYSQRERAPAAASTSTATAPGNPAQHAAMAAMA